MAIEHPSFGTLDPDRIIIFDTTLRDGEQSPGFSMNLEEKLRMAETLAELGVDVIEAGFPIASDGDFEAVQAIAAAVRRPIIAGLARACAPDIERAWQALKGAARPRIHVFLATSDIHLKYKLRISREQCLEQARESVPPCYGQRFTIGAADLPRHLARWPAFAARESSGRRRSNCPDAA